MFSMAPPCSKWVRQGKVLAAREKRTAQNPHSAERCDRCRPQRARGGRAGASAGTPSSAQPCVYAGLRGDVQYRPRGHLRGSARLAAAAQPRRPRAPAASLHADGGRAGAPSLINLLPPPFNPPPGRLSSPDRRGCKPFEVHQHGEVLLYFRSPRFIPGRGRGRPSGLPRYLGLPCRTRGHSPPGRGREGAGGTRTGTRARHLVTATAAQVSAPSWAPRGCGCL